MLEKYAKVVNSQDKSIIYYNNAFEEAFCALTGMLGIVGGIFLLIAGILDSFMQNILLGGLVISIGALLSLLHFEMVFQKGSLSEIKPGWGWGKFNELP